jgi:peptidoglycan/xylan/chitin deacetylase (PgdA/CDA1 family)
MSRGEIRSQLAKCNESIKAITGKDNMLFRPPSGAYNNDVVDAASSLGMYTIQWSLDSLDYEGLSEKQIFDRIVPKVKNGDIILFHNDIKNTPKALDQILHALKDKGFEFVSAYDLIYKENYTIDYSGMQKQVQNIH